MQDKKFRAPFDYLTEKMTQHVFANVMSCKVKKEFFELLPFFEVSKMDWPKTVNIVGSNSSRV
jgi:hypothetical protein